MNSNINTILQKAFPFITTIIIALILANILFLFLPKVGVEKKNNKSIELKYSSYSGFYSQKSFQNKTSFEERKSQDRTQLGNIQAKYQLQAIYSTTSNKGWIIVKEKSNNKTLILEHMEQLQGYTLTSLFKAYVIFEKNEKKYKMDLLKEKTLSYKSTKNTSYGDEKIMISDDKVLIKRSYLNSQIKDLSNVWKNIQIEELKKANKIEGFKVKYINKGSIFNKLGLVKNDIIQGINGKRIKSYRDIFKVLNEIDRVNELALSVLRNNEQVELNYEID